MKITIIAALLSLSLSSFAQDALLSENLVCEVQGRPEEKIIFEAALGADVLDRTVLRTVPWSQEMESSDGKKCKLESGKLVCWLGQKYHIDLDVSTTLPYFRMKYFSGTRTIIAPPGHDLRDVRCFVQ